MEESPICIIMKIAGRRENRWSARRGKSSFARLDIPTWRCYYNNAYSVWVWRSLVACLNGVQEAGGSNPLTQTMQNLNFDIPSIKIEIFSIYHITARIPRKRACECKALQSAKFIAEAASGRKRQTDHPVCQGNQRNTRKRDGNEMNRSKSKCVHAARRIAENCVRPENATHGR